MKYFFVLLLFIPVSVFSQLKWQNVDSLYQPLPSSIHVFYTNEKIDTASFKAYYVIADIKDRLLNFTTDTSYKRRLTPKQFHEKNGNPIVVVNCAFFSFDKNKNLNLIIKDGKLVAYNLASLKNSGKDSAVPKIPFRSAIGITKHRYADVAWTFTDSSLKFARASETVVTPRDATEKNNAEKKWYLKTFKKWKMKTAVGGGPVLLQNGEIFITNEEERMFMGKAINDKHPRTAMGYTKDNKLIILVVEGRSESGGGATFTQEAQIFKDLGCVEALNLDGGGSSCLLINGKETIKPSDKEGERPVPGVFLIKKNK
ncbi:MAG: phosphodiester glycosidase family protein [Bacteroidota bacterium]|nr:phosphodiester glycosidase family protein [Bacteroidota bacterium]